MYPYFDYFTLFLYSSIGLFCAYLLNLSINKPVKIRCPQNSGYIFFYLILVLLATFRLVDNGIGGIDAINYEKIFLNCFSQNRFDSIDPLFGAFNKIIRSITSSPVLYRSICYSIIVIAYIVFIKTFSQRGISSIPFIVLLIPYLRSFNTMRSSLAIAVILFGLVLLKNRHQLYGVILIILSSLIHRMSILYVMFVPFYILFNKYQFKLSNKKLIFWSSSILIIGYFGALKIQQYVIANNLLTGPDSYYISRSLGSSILSSAIILIPLVLIFIFWLIGNKRLPDNDNIKFLKLMVLFDIIITPVACILGMWRVNEYFYIGRLVLWAYLIPAICYRISPSNKIIFKMIFVILFFAWLVYRIVKEWEPCGLMPYKLIFL